MISIFKNVYLKILFRIIFTFLLFSIGLDLRRSFTYCNIPSNQNVNYVYRTISDMTLNQPSKYVYFNKIIYKSKVNLVFLSDMEGNIQIIDTNQKNKIVSEFKIEVCVSGFILSSDGKQIICYSKQKFICYLIADMKKGIIEKSFEQTVNSPNQIIQVLIDDKEEYLFLATTDGVIKVFTNNNYNKIVQIYQYQHSRASFVRFKLSYNRNYIIIDQDYQGLHILKLNWNKTQKELVNIVKAGFFESQTSYDSYIFNDEKTIISLDYWGGVQIGSIDLLEQVNPLQYPLQLKYNLEQWWQFNDPMPYCLTVDEDKKILFVGSRSQGIFIIDINDLSNPVLIQNINIPSYAMSIQVSSDIQYIYYTNRQQFFIFSLTQPFFQDEYVHFFNEHQSNLTEVQNTRWLWRCYVDQSDHYLFSASDVNGLQIYDIQQGPNEMQLLFSLNSNTEYLQIDDMVFLQNQSYLIIPYTSQKQMTIFRVYDIRNLNKIYEISNVKYDRIRSVSQMQLGENGRYIVSTYEQSIIILDCFDFLKEQNDQHIKEIKVVGEYEFFEINKDMTTDVTFILNDKYIIVCFSYFGMALVKITPSETMTDMLDLQVIQTIETYGGESIILSKKYSNMGFISDGLNGILIVEFDTSIPDYAQISLLSRLKMVGWVNQITLVNDESQMVTASIDGGYITIVDINDIRNPFIVTEFSFKEKYNFSSCKSKDYFFLNTEKGIRGFLMKKQSLIHTDIAQFIPEKNIYIPLTKSDSFKIGQSIIMNFELIFPQQGQKIQNVYYYKDRQKLSLPSWISFNQQTRQLTIKVNREGLYSSSYSFKQNILVVLSIFSLNKLSFVYEKNKINDNTDSEFIQTTKEESALIYEYLEKNGYINWTTGIVNPDMIQDNQIYFQIEGVQKNDRLFKAVTHTLQQSYTFNPIYFNIQSSLHFNLSPQNSTYISSLSNIVSITLQFYTFSYNQEEAEVFDKLVGIPGGSIFINQIKTITTGLSITISKGGEILKVEGPPSKLNEFIESKIVYWYQNPTDQQVNQQNLTTPDNMFVVVLVQDLINYDQQLVYRLLEVPFLKLKGPITQKSDDNLIQDQFNKEYTDGIVYITNGIDIQFERESFYDDDQLSISYSATLEDGSEIPPDYWLQFQPSVMRLYGIVPRREFGQTIILRIVAKNNYTVYWNELKIHAYGVPFLYVLSLIAQIISPILFLIGLYRFKYILYNIFLRHRNRYSDEICYINQPYNKKIPLIGENLQIAKFLVEGLKSIASIEQNGIQKRIRENSRKLTRTTIRASPYLTTPDNQNINIMNLSSNTNAQLKDINPPQFNLSRQQIKSPKHPISLTSRRRSLFLQEHIKHTSLRSVNISKQKIQVDNENQQNSSNQIENQDQIIQKYSYQKAEIHQQFQSLPNIEDKNNKDQKNDHQIEVTINEKDENIQTDRQEQFQSHNVSINDQFQNTSQSKQEQQNNMISILVTSGIQNSPKSPYQTNYQESPKSPELTTFNLNSNFEQKDFILQDQDFTTNSNQIQQDNTKQIKIQLNLSTNKTLSQIYETSKQNIQAKTKDTFSKSHFSPIKSKKDTSENNQYTKKSTLENNQDIMKEEQSNSVKQNNINEFSQIKEEQDEKDQSQCIVNSNATGQTNRLSIQRNINGFLTPHTDHSQNWGKETGRTSPIKRQMSITPMGAEFKKQVNTLKNLQKKNQRQQRTVFEAKYVDENGCVSMENVVNDIIQQNSSFVVQMKKYQTSDFVVELKNKDSILYNYIRALIARHLLSLDKQSTLLYNILKSYAQSKFSFSANDWYKAYVDINAQQESDMYGFQMCFPRTQINSTQINRVIRSLLLFEPNNFDDQSCHDEEFPQPMTQTQRMLPLQNSFSQQNQQIFNSFSSINFTSKYANSNCGFNQSLIEEVIIADALGLVTKIPSQRFPSVGESLHIRGYKVDSVEAFSIQKRDTNFCSKLREVFGLDYHRYGSSQNIKLPSWMNFYQKQNLIFLEGTPSSHDIEEILIRIYNSKRYIIKEFILKITNEFNVFESQASQKIKYDKKLSDDDKLIQPRKISDSRRISFDRSFQYNQEINRSPKMSCISSNNNILNQSKTDQFRQTKSVTTIQQQQQSLNDPLSSPSSIFSITSQNKLQLQSEEDNKYTFEQTTGRVPQTSDTHRFIQDISPYSANNVPEFSQLKRPYLNQASPKYNNAQINSDKQNIND